MKSPAITLLSLASLAVALVVAAAPVSATAQDGPAYQVAETLVREASGYGFKRWLRDRVYDESDEARYGLEFDDAWSECNAELPLLVQVHGYNSNCARNDAVMQPFRTEGYPCASFNYPNDHGLAASAARMSRSLKAVARQYPNRRLVLVTHSMGGLVARACLEDDSLDPGNVDRLLMIAPPSQGTLLAHVAVATDVWEHWLGRKAGGPWTRWRDSVVDGLGEAADDLVPDSPFLAELNSRPRNPEVDYTIFLGTRATFEQEEMQWLRNALKNSSGRIPGLRGATGRLERLLDDMDELVDGKGDGVVAVKRGRLAGVDDVVILPFGHLAVTGKGDAPPVVEVQQELMARVTAGR